MNQSPDPVDMDGLIPALDFKTWDTASAHQFDFWTDNDLYRAIENPEHTEPGPERDAELTEYVEELRRRAAARAADAQRRYDLNVKYGIPLDPSGG